MKILIPTLIAFVIGFFSNQFFSKPVIKNFTQCADLVDAKTNLNSLSQNEYLEYTKIKDLKQKYEKADELLGKIMLLFLADVGFKAHKEMPTEPVAAAVASAPTQAPIVESHQSETPSATPAPSNSTSLIGKSSVIRNLRSEKQVHDVLDKAIIDSPKIASALGSTPTQKQIRLLEGRYIGTIKFIDLKRESLNVVWDLLPDYSKSGFSGTFNLNIHGPGKNSESSGRGDISNIVSLAEDQDGFLVTSCGDDCFLQLYYNSQADQFYGNYYEFIKGTKKSERLGLIELKK